MKRRAAQADTAAARSFRWRSGLVLGLVLVCAAGLSVRALELQWLDHGFLAKQGDDRTMRVAKIVAQPDFHQITLQSGKLAKNVCISTEAMGTLSDNYFDLLPGGPEVTTTFNSTSSGVGGGLTGLVIHSSTLGDTFTDGGNKVVQMALDLPKNTIVTSVRLCYELSSAESFVSQIRLAQVQDPPAAAVVLLDDGTNLTDPGPICVDSATTSIKANGGAILLSLRTDFGDVADRIVVRALGLHVK
mgnify:CR=1 FL=1